MTTPDTSTARRTSARTSGTNPLREVFADLFAYVLLFRASCVKKPLPTNEVRDRIEALLAEQDRRLKGGDIASETYREALFAVLSWVDEMILTSAWPFRGQWRHIMLTTFGTLNAGEQFYQHLDALPIGARDIKEIYYLCLALGFEGKYALVGGPELREVRERLYRDVFAGREETLRGRWFPQAYVRPRTGTRLEIKKIGVVWFALVFLVPAVLFGAYWYLLERSTDAVLARINARVQAPPVSRARTLVEELRARGIQAEQAARGVVITLPGLLFEVASSDLSAEGQRKIAEVADALKRNAAGIPILVEGHASRERGTSEELNQRLSDDRATKVAATLVTTGLRNERVTGVGFGARRPVASNDNEDGRRLNRRVEIIVENMK